MVIKIYLKIKANTLSHFFDPSPKWVKIYSNIRNDNLFHKMLGFNNSILLEHLLFTAPIPITALANSQWFIWCSMFKNTLCLTLEISMIVFPLQLTLGANVT